MAWELLLTVMPLDGSEPLVSYKSYPTQLACQAELKNVIAMATKSLGTDARIDGSCKQVTQQIDSSNANSVRTSAAPSSSASPNSSSPCDELAAGRSVATISAEAYIKDVKSGIPEPKSQFETTADFETRKRKKLQSFLEASPTVAVKTTLIFNSFFKYNADTEELNYEGLDRVRCLDDNDRACVDLDIVSDTTTVNSYDISFSLSNGASSPYPTMTVPAERAKRIIESNGSVSLIMVVSPEAPYIVSRMLGRNDSPTSNDQRWYYNHQMPAKLMCAAWFVDNSLSR